MADKTQRTPLVLNDRERQKIQGIAQSRTALLRDVQRAKILLAYADRVSLSSIAMPTGTTRPTVYKCIDKALSMGWEAGLRDLFHRPKEPTMTPEAKAWAVSLGLAAELWTHQALAHYIRTHSTEAGHPSLSRVAKCTVQRILDEQELKPHQVRYYLERCGPEFDRKMREVLMVYREVSLAPPGGDREVYTVSVDEKPGVQAPGVTAPDRSPVPGTHPAVSRDPEDVRMGTLSILAALDLHDGQVIAQVHERHRSREFVELLKELDRHYPPEAQIRVILDNRSAHVSQETRAFLRPIRAGSLAELKERILEGVQEINENPVVRRWKIPKPSNRMLKCNYFSGSFYESHRRPRPARGLFINQPPSARHCGCHHLLR